VTLFGPAAGLCPADHGYGQGGWRPVDAGAGCSRPYHAERLKPGFLRPNILSAIS